MQGRDYNFKDFRPMMFSTLVEVGNADGDIGKNAVSINDRPFILKQVTHQITAPIFFDAVNGYDERQHGFYTLDWSLYNQDRYWQGDPPMADAAFGSVRTGIWIPLSSPIALEKSRTLNVSIGNVGVRYAPYKVQVIFHGVEDYRKRDTAGNLIESEQR